jgi:hypothetical protein
MLILNLHPQCPDRVLNGGHRALVARHRRLLHVAGRMDVATPKRADHSILLTTSLATLFIFDHVRPAYVDAYESVQLTPLDI